MEWSKPNQNFRVFWRFAEERQRIFYKRYLKVPAPWTSDPILQQYKFTNCFRVADRVSQYLIRNVQYDKNEVAPYTREDVIFRTLLFKVFNRIETWEYLNEQFLGIGTKTFDPNMFAEALDDYKQPRYSGAYMVCGSTHVFNTSVKHRAHIRMLEMMLDNNLPQEVLRADSMEAIYAALIRFPLMGKFSAYQFAVDLNYSSTVNFSENDFVEPGPGARRGVKRCFDGVHSKRDIVTAINWTMEYQERLAELYGYKAPKLFGRRLHLIDVQNLFCEIEKYLRTYLGEVSKRGRPRRPRAQFEPDTQPIDYFFPPKWNLNLDYVAGYE